jgi:hypothetical protein
MVNQTKSNNIINGILGLAFLCTTFSCRQTPTSSIMDWQGDYVVTGFGNWAGEDGTMIKNPTGAMIESGALQKAMRAEYERNGREFPEERFKFHVLPVNGGSAGTPITAENRAAEAAYYEQLRNSNNRHVVNLGVNPNVDGQFAVERTAVNNYNGKPIDPSLPANAYYQTSTKAPDYEKNLNSQLSAIEGQPFSVTQGKPQDQLNNFDCNKTFWRGMSNVDQTGENKNRVYNVDFVHVPYTAGGKPVETVPTAEATAKILYQTFEGQSGMRTEGQMSAVKPVIPSTGPSENISSGNSSSGGGTVITSSPSNSVPSVSTPPVSSGSAPVSSGGSSTGGTSTGGSVSSGYGLQ